MDVRAVSPLLILLPQQRQPDETRPRPLQQPPLLPSHPVQTVADRLHQPASSSHSSPQTGTLRQPPLWAYQTSSDADAPPVNPTQTQPQTLPPPSSNPSPHLLLLLSPPPLRHRCLSPSPHNSIAALPPLLPPQTRLTAFVSSPISTLVALFASNPSPAISKTTTPLYA